MFTMAKHCAIDIGTNSTRLLIAEGQGNFLKPFLLEIEVTRLGQGVDKDRVLKLEAMERTIDALKKFRAKADSQGVATLQVVATSAVRDSVNKQEFVDKVARETGLQVEIIPGEEEAQLTYWGAVADLKWPSGNILVFDLGGGSTEFIVGNENGIKTLASVDIGAVRMTEAFLHSNPVLEVEYFAMKEHIRQSLAPFFSQIKDYQVELLLGVGGTATSLAAMDQKLRPYDPNKVHGYSVSLDTVKKLAEKLQNSTIEERQTIPGLHPKRADIILGGVAVVEAILESLSLGKLLVSENDLLLGTIYRLLKS